jgi:hypothetical protein
LKVVMVIYFQEFASVKIKCSTPPLSPTETGCLPHIFIKDKRRDVQ